ncbi:hypothetical protein PHAVU_008G251500 [Phaseolus vulgaris]|uniref:DUF4228 domain-containing protein n=1 Tax=Phaseolus vulgaris TaxID=3885 RepID=V7BC87_PHAVU|nr:hypothetical protein PHAVU_008G251500g [Phaseolus vulgaris]ESW14081.1 hypothetical protein PHAVU_008G251500g [Phaseolus vulgaris]
MGNSLRCCLACVLPCGALDLIRIVHLNGCVEEITRPITAGEVLKANPNHVLSKPTSQGVVRRILILSPETELKRGSIYFLIPAASLPPEKRRLVKHATARTTHHIDNQKNQVNNKVSSKKSNHDLSPSQQCDDKGLVISREKKFSRRDRRNGRGGLWRPRLESISED